MSTVPVPDGRACYAMPTAMAGSAEGTAAQHHLEPAAPLRAEAVKGFTGKASGIRPEAAALLDADVAGRRPAALAADPAAHPRHGLRHGDAGMLGEEQGDGEVARAVLALAAADHEALRPVVRERRREHLVAELPGAEAVRHEGAG